MVYFCQFISIFFSIQYYGNSSLSSSQDFISLTIDILDSLQNWPQGNGSLVSLGIDCSGSDANNTNWDCLWTKYFLKAANALWPRGGAKGWHEPDSVLSANWAARRELNSEQVSAKHHGRTGRSGQPPLMPVSWIAHRKDIKIFINPNK